MFRYPGSRVWWIAYYNNETPAREVRESSGSRKAADARRLLRQRVGDKTSGRPLPATRRCTFENMAALLKDDYTVNGRRTLPRMLQNVEHLRGTFGHDHAGAITTDRIVAYQAARLAEGAAPGTLRLELSALKRMFRLARRHGRIHERPDFENPVPDNARQGFFEEADLRRVVEHLPEHLRPVVLFAYFTGWRRGEVLGLRWPQVDFEAGAVRLEPGTTKNGDGRTFPLSHGSELEAILREQREQTTALERERARIVPCVFHKQGEPLRDFYHAWLTACRKARVPGRLFHDLRRTAVRNLERAGVPRSWAMMLTGHKTESVFRRYAIVAEQDLRDGAARLAAYHAEQRRASRDSTQTR